MEKEKVLAVKDLVDGFYNVQISMVDNEEKETDIEVIASFRDKEDAIRFGHKMCGQLGFKTYSVDINKKISLDELEKYMQKVLFKVEDEKITIPLKTYNHLIKTVQEFKGLPEIING